MKYQDSIIIKVAAGMQDMTEAKPAVRMACEASISQRAFIVTMLLMRPQLIWLIQHLF